MILNNGQSVALAPQGLAELVPQLSTSYYYPEDVGMRLEREFAWYGELFGRQPWIFVTVSKRANAIARLPLVVWNESGVTRQLDTVSGYAQLLADPCPYLDSFSFWFWVQATRDIYGEAFLAIVRDKNTTKPISLLPMHPSRVAIERAPYTGRKIYYFQSGTSYGTGLVQFDQDDVVPILDFNPIRTERGLSRLRPLRPTVMNEDSSRNAMSAAWRNGGRPGVVLTSDKRLGPEGRKRLQDSFDGIHAGSSQAGRTLVLEDGVTAKEMQLSAQELQWVESRKINREEVGAVFDISPPIIHILDHATFSNITALERAFYRDTMAPPIESLESILDYHLGKYWTGQKAARFSLDEVMRGDFETRAESGRALATVGALTPNEVRELMGYGPFEGHDAYRAGRLYANASQQELGFPAERISLTGAVAHDPDGVAIDMAPTTTVPAGGDSSSSDGIDVPQLTSGASSTPEAQVATLDYSSKPLRELKGGIGRGLTPDEIKDFACKLGEKYPDHLEQILVAVRIAIAQKNHAA